MRTSRIVVLARFGASTQVAVLAPVGALLRDGASARVTAWTLIASLARIAALARFGASARVGVSVRLGVSARVAAWTLIASSTLTVGLPWVAAPPSVVALPAVAVLARAVGFPALCAASPLASPVPEIPSPENLQLTLVTTNHDIDMDEARTLFASAGGRVAIVVAPRSIIGWIPPGADVADIERAGHVQHTSARNLSDLEDRVARAVVSAFAKLLDGERDVAPLTGSKHRTWPEGVPKHPAPRPAHTATQPDAAHPTTSSSETQRGPAAPERDVGRDPGASDTLLPTQDGESMAGTVWVSLFFVESDGSGTDPDLFDWSEEGENSAFADVLTGLTWWASQAQSRPGSDCWVAFYLDPYFATSDSRCSQWMEPVLHPSTSYIHSIHEVLENFGFVEGSSFDRARALNRSKRTVHGTDRAFSAFVVASDGQPFANGGVGYASLGGPHFVQAWSASVNPDVTFAHETAHMFGACDEYRSSACDCSPCNNGVANGNCINCNNESSSCIMRSNSWQLCDWTRGHLGWTILPCAPPPLPEPVLDSVAPSVMAQGERGFVGLAGANFTHGTRTEWGAGVLALSERVWSASRLLVELSVEPDAVAGTRDVIVMTPDLQADTLEAGFLIATRTELTLLEYAVRHEVQRGAILEWQLRRDAGATGTLAILRTQEREPRAWRQLAALRLDARSFVDESITAGRWVYRLALHDGVQSRVLGEQVLHVEAPGRVVLLGNVPNPFNASTHIRLQLADAAAVDLRIFDLRGRLVRQLRATLPAGIRSIPWDGRDQELQTQPSGTYIYEVRVGQIIAHGRMTLVQ